jgi:hypothetical protein
VEGGKPGLGEQRRGLPRAHAVLAHHHDRPAVARQHGRGGGDELDGKQHRAGDVAELLVLAGRPHVEDHGPGGDQELGLVRGDVLQGAGATTVLGDGEVRHGGRMIGSPAGRASARDHPAGERVTMAFPALFVSHGAPTAALDAWVDERLTALDVPGLRTYASQAPHAALAVPTSEHFDPVFFVLGARDPRDRVESVAEGFRYGTLSLRSFALAAP